MTLYHGSENIIEAPEFGKGARNNDYGKGFYCTENIELAREWACAKNKSGYVNVYEFDLTGLKVLNLNDGQYVRSEIVDREIYYVRKNEREREARKEYRMSKLQKDTINQLYMIDIMREGMENDDVRLFRGLS